jgi:hypothetical protein
MQTALLLSVLAPAIVAAVLAVAAARLRWVLALVAPLGALAAYVPVRGVPALPPADASVWAIWIAFVAAAWVLAERLAPRALRIGARTGIGALVTVLVSWPLVSRGWSPGTTAMAVAAGAALIAGAWSLLDERATELAGPALPLGMAGLSAGAAVVLGASGTALLAQAAGGAAAAWGVLLLFAARRPDMDLRAPIGPTLVLLGGLLAGGVNYAEVGATSVVLLALGAFAVALVRGPTSTRSRWHVAATVGLLVAVSSGAAIASSLAGGAAPADEAEADDDGYDGYD